jgi:hypothetical protein
MFAPVRNLLESSTRSLIPRSLWSVQSCSHCSLQHLLHSWWQPIACFESRNLSVYLRLKAAEKRSQVLQGELNNCKERLRATSELLQIANQHLALFQQKMREGERRAELVQLHEEVRCQRTYREMNIRQNRMLASVRGSVKTKPF